MNVHNIPVNEDLIIYGKVSIESGKECMRKLLAGRQMPDGVFAVEDFTALGALQSIKEAKRKVPDEVALIGFANEAFGEYLIPSLSTVNQQTVHMGEEAASLFFECLDKSDLYKTKERKVVLEPGLICRESSLKFSQ